MSVFTKKLSETPSSSAAFEVPSEDVHDARIVALIDLGTQEKTFNNVVEWSRKCLLVFELDEAMTGYKGVNHVVGVEYTLSHNEKAKLRKLASSLEIDTYGELLGAACTVQVSHVVKQSDFGEKRYVKVGTIAPVAKKKRDAVFAAKRTLTLWSVEDGKDDDLPDWLPRIYGNTVKDVIAASVERNANSRSSYQAWKASKANNNGAATALAARSEGAIDDDTPF